MKKKSYKFIAETEYENICIPILKIVLPKKNPCYVWTKYRITVEEVK